jgi:hypothetical protein
LLFLAFAQLPGIAGGIGVLMHHRWTKPVLLLQGASRANRIPIRDGTRCVPPTARCCVGDRGPEPLGRVKHPARRARAARLLTSPCSNTAVHVTLGWGACELLVVW